MLPSRSACAANELRPDGIEWELVNLPARNGFETRGAGAGEPVPLTLRGGEKKLDCEGCRVERRAGSNVGVKAVGRNEPTDEAGGSG